MANPAVRLRQEIALAEFLPTLEGKLVRISQLLSYRPGTDFEARSTTQVQLTFRVKTAFLAMTGGNHFTLYANDGDTAYTFCTAMLEEFTRSGDTTTVTEVYGTGAERRTIVQVIADAA